MKYQATNYNLSSTASDQIFSSLCIYFWNNFTLGFWTCFAPI